MITVIINAQTPNFEWAKQMKSNNDVEGKSIAADPWGNVYTVGHFEGTIDLNPGAGTATKSSAGNDDIYISKLDALGNFIWGKRIGGTGTDWAIELKVGTDGSVYYTGVFEDVVDFNPNTGVAHLDATNSVLGACAFVSKLDSAGNFGWAKIIEGGWQSYGTSITLDNVNNVYVAGIFDGSVSFNGTTYIPNYVSNSSSDIYLAKYNALGSLVWGKTIGGRNDEDEPHIKIDATYNLYVTASFQDTVDCNPNAGVFNVISQGAGRDMFITKLDSVGSFIWAKSVGGVASSVIPSSIDVDGLGNIYTAGYFDSEADFDPSSGGVFLMDDIGVSDMFIHKLDASGNFVWAKQIGGYNADAINSIDADISGNIYITGYIAGNALLNPNTTTWTAYHGLEDIFILKLDGSGSYQWSSVIGDTQFQHANSIYVSPSAGIYVTGGFYTYGGPIDFDPTPGVFGMQTTGGITEIFILKLCDATVAPINTTPTANGTICAGNSAVLSASGTGIINWYSAPTNGVSLGSGVTFTTSALTNNTTYYAEATTCNTGTTRTAISVTVNPTPTVSITGNSTICAGNSATLTASGANTYVWSGSGTSSPTKTVNPISTTVYTVTGTGSNGCAATASLAVNVNSFPLPIVTIGGNGSICSGSSATLTASGASTYVWAGGGTTATKIVSPVNTTTYSVIGTDANGCYNTSSKSVTVNATPTITVNSGSICSGNSFTIVPTGASTYTYSSGTAIVTPIISTTYSVTGTSAQGCVSSNTVVSSVTVNTKPIIAVNSGSICLGNSFIIVPTGASTYTYSGGSNVVSPTTSTSYSVTGTSAQGCMSSNTAISSVTVNAKPSIIASGNNSGICSGQTVTLTVTGAATYTWSTNSNAPSIVVSPTITTTYSVNGTNGNGCSNYATVTQSVSLCAGIETQQDIMNAITLYPNPGNGLFMIKSTLKVRVILTNNLGQIVFDTFINEGEHPIDIQQEASGVYFVTVMSDYNRCTFKLIKN